MGSVVERIKEIRHPVGGYFPVTNFQKYVLNDDIVLSPMEQESVSPAQVGMAVDYLTRVMIGVPVDEAFHASLRGARKCNAVDRAIQYLSNVRGLDFNSVLAAVKLSTFDVCVGGAGSVCFARTNDLNICVNEVTYWNIVNMVRRGVSFLQMVGPVRKCGFDCGGYYPSYVDSGVGDFLTDDTIWDFKVSKLKPSPKYALQVLMYWIMCQHSESPELLRVNNIGLFNPRLGTYHFCNVRSVDAGVLQRVEDEVLGYSYTVFN